ncbi:AraC family transcriptional regulator [Enterococcus diestrammenae]|uniref:AraC family transcriptional regulator n=1 Tax=Enterococcus diestrammenae TaxID=1155073 RepID=UPI00195B6997
MDYKYMPVDFASNQLFSTKTLANTDSETVFIQSHWHNSIELIYCQHGSLEIKINSKKHLLKTGMLLFINSAQFHSIKIEQNAFAIAVNLHLDAFGDYRHVIKTFIFDTDLSKDNQLEMLEIIKNIELLHNISHQNLSTPLVFKANSCMNEIIFLLLAKFRLKGIKYQSTVTSQKYIIVLSEITSYIEQNYAHNLTLENIAEKFSYSPTYFSKFFKKHTKQSFSNYLANVRLTHAYYDIMQTDLPLKQIALNNGFPNVRSFSTLFKSIYGSQPNIFRKVMADKSIEFDNADE